MDSLQKIVGTIIKNIYMDGQHLTFDTDKGSFGFTVIGDCCSRSYFYDFHGVSKLLAGNPVVSVKELALNEPDGEVVRNGGLIQAYGVELITEDPQFGEVTSVFSFRNESNGWYGGWMEADTPYYDAPRITEDVLENVWQ